MCKTKTWCTKINFLSQKKMFDVAQKVIWCQQEQVDVAWKKVILKKVNFFWTSPTTHRQLLHIACNYVKNIWGMDLNGRLADDLQQTYEIPICKKKKKKKKKEKANIITEIF